ncbi:bifunctional DNA primase/polymerase [Nonomuraea sediminis]|uniref:bifunctional DNA primase/polymerase n=1 Tax=Nonomuraea sediminis TaxID=2835864 RepID=UPI001BDC4E5E
MAGTFSRSLQAGNTPARGFTRWEHNATTHPARLAAWWRRAPINVGVACGPSNLLVIDLDLAPAENVIRPGHWPCRHSSLAWAIFRHQE